MQLCAAGSHPPKEQVRARARMRFSARFMRQKPHGPRSRDARFCPDAVEHVVQQLGATQHSGQQRRLPVACGHPCRPERRALRHDGADQPVWLPEFGSTIDFRRPAVAAILRARLRLCWSSERLADSAQA